MQAKLNYLRNPRCIPPSESGNQALIKSSKHQPKEINIRPPPIKEWVADLLFSSPVHPENSYIIMCIIALLLLIYFPQLDTLKSIISVHYFTI